MKDNGSAEHDVFIKLSSPNEVNEPWLDSKSIAIEKGLIARMSDKLLGQSVTANCEINGFEIDFTIAEADADAQRTIIAEVMSIVEDIAGIEVGTGSAQTTQIHSGFRIDDIHSDQHDLTPA